MFLKKLCSQWTKQEFDHNELTKYYIGNEIPETQKENIKILKENMDYYKDCINRAISFLRMICDIPIIYTVRSTTDGGFLDTSSSWDIYNDFVLYGAVTLN